MNYLAHLYLAGDSPGLAVGGFLGDFVKGPLKGAYPDHIEAGMKLHRQIDVWSDRHPSVEKIRSLMPPEFGKYTGIISDVLSDHFLAMNWDNYCTDSIDSFALKKLDLLSSHVEVFPDNACQVLERMRSGSWLTNYHNLKYSTGALSRIGQRLRRENPLHKTEQPILKNYDQLDELCIDILGDLRINVAEWRAENTANPN